MLEAIELIESLVGERLPWSYDDVTRMGDHQWWISDVRKFAEDYPEWTCRFSLESMLSQMHEVLRTRD